MNVVGGGFLAYQDHGAGLAHLHRFFGSEGGAANGSAGLIDSRRDVHQFLERRLVENRVQELIELLRRHTLK